MYSTWKTYGQMHLDAGNNTSGICDLLGCYVAYDGNSLSTFRDNLSASFQGSRNRSRKPGTLGVQHT